MWPQGFSIRLIGTKDCIKCTAFKRYLDQSKYPYAFYDAGAPEVQKQLDEWMITDMPVLQILKEGDIVYQFLPGIKSTKTILTMMYTKGAKR